MAGAEADRSPSLRRWGGFGEAGRREDMGSGATVINMNKGLDARIGELMISGETSWARAPGGGRRVRRCR